MTNLRAIRDKQGISQRKLAELSGVHHISLARIEMGVLDPRLSTLRKIAQALNVTMSELVGDKSPTNKRRSYGTDKTKGRLVR